jgi:hypothetical protein
MSSKKNSPQQNPWWEVEDEGNNTDLNLKAKYDCWEDKTIGKIKERLGLEEETDYSDEEVSGKNNDDGDGKIEGDENDYNDDYGGEKGDDDKKGGGKVVRGNDDES